MPGDNLLGGGDEESRLRAVTDGLKRRFGSDAYRIPIGEIEREVTHAVRNYDDARIRDFVPILAERDVRSKLTRAARGR